MLKPIRRFIRNGLLSDELFCLLALMGLAMKTISLSIAGSKQTGMVWLAVVLGIIVIRLRIGKHEVIAPRWEKWHSLFLTAALTFAMALGFVEFIQQNNPTSALNVVCASLLAIVTTPFMARNYWFLGLVYNVAVLTLTGFGILPTWMAALSWLAAYALVKSVDFLNTLELDVK